MFYLYKFQYFIEIIFWCSFWGKWITLHYRVCAQPAEFMYKSVNSIGNHIIWVISILDSDSFRSDSLISSNRYHGAYCGGFTQFHMPKQRMQTYHIDNRCFVVLQIDWFVSLVLQCSVNGIVCILCAWSIFQVQSDRSWWVFYTGFSLHAENIGKRKTCIQSKNRA